MTIAAVDSKSFTLTVDGKSYTMVLPLAIKDTIRLRSEVGWSQTDLLKYLLDPDLDVFAACVWMARLQAGETVTFESVADALSYATDVAVGVAEDEHPQS